MQTIDKKYVDRRISELRRRMRTKGINVSMIWEPDNEYYLSGFRAISYTRPIILLVYSDKTQYILPALEEDHAKLNAHVDEFFIYHEKIQNSHLDFRYNHILDRLLDEMKKGSSIGIEMGFLSAFVHNSLKEKDFKLKDIGADLVEMRAVKDEEEIYWLDQAGKLSDIALETSLANVKTGMSELEFDSYGDRKLLEVSSEKFPDKIVGYDNWTCSGILRSSMPHLYSSTRKFEKNDIVVHSRQVWINGYRAENERTFLIGNPTDEQKKCLQIAIAAQEAGFAAVKPGVKAQDVDVATFRVFEKAGYADYVQHRVGHGLGLSEHEEPYLTFDNELILKEGMVYSIEPGIYIPGVGGFRHSDTVIITKDGCRSITSSPRKIENLIF